MQQFCNNFQEIMATITGSINGQCYYRNDASLFQPRYALAYIFCPTNVGYVYCEHTTWKLDAVKLYLSAK